MKENIKEVVEETKVKEEKKRVRRDNIKRGEVNQKLMSFRADFVTVRILEGVKNKGRLINDLIRAWSEGREYEGDEIPPEEYMTDYYQP